MRGWQSRAIEENPRLYMVAIIVVVLIIAFGPGLWVAVVMRWHGKPIANLPGTGGELAQHLVEVHGLDGVTVEQTQRLGDHYDPTTRTVRLSPAHFAGRSLTAVAVAAHEVGHAMQHHAGDPKLALRSHLAPVVQRLGQLSVALASVAPFIGLLTRHPVPFSVLVGIGLCGLISRVVLHLLTLPVEWDASFGKALPVLIKGQYIAPAERPAVRRVLRAAALTYVAAALADVLNLARWAQLLVRR